MCVYISFYIILTLYLWEYHKSNVVLELNRIILYKSEYSQFLIRMNAKCSVASSNRKLQFELSYYEREKKSLRESHLAKSMDFFVGSIERGREGGTGFRFLLRDRLYEANFLSFLIARLVECHQPLFFVHHVVNRNPNNRSAHFSYSLLATPVIRRIFCVPSLGLPSGLSSRLHRIINFFLPRIILTAQFIKPGHSWIL